MGTEGFKNRENIYVIPHAPYSPDLAIFDFFLFGYVKQKLRGKVFPTLNDAVEEMRSVIDGISAQMWKETFRNWFKRLQMCVDNYGKYFQ